MDISKNRTAYMNEISKKIHLKDCSFTKNGKKYNYYALAESSKVDGKNHKKIIKYLGELTPSQVATYKTTLNSLNSGSDTLIDLNDLVFEEKKNFLDVAVLHLLWNKLGFSTVFESAPSQKELSTANVAEILTLARLLQPSSNIQTVEWLQQTFLPEFIGIPESRYNGMKIFHELSEICKKKKRLEERFLQIAKQEQGPDGFDIYFVDGTTTYFEGTGCELGKGGLDKTTGYKTHMILIMLVTNRAGFPCMWDVYDGSQKEVSKFKDAAIRLSKEYKITNVTFCFDRGFASIQNFESIEKLVSKFISGVDKNQIEKVFKVNEFQKTREKIIARTEQLEALAEESPIQSEREKIRRYPIDGFYTSDCDRYYKDIGIYEGYRYIAGFSSEIYYGEMKRRERSQQEAFLEICKITEELSAAKKDRDLDVVAKRVDKILDDHKMQGLIEYEIIPLSVKVPAAKKRPSSIVQSCKIKYSLNIEAWHKASLLDGIFVYITDHKEKDSHGHFLLSAYDITKHYKDKWVIESNFKDLKNIINIRPLYVRLPEHVRASVTVAIAGQFMNIYIAKALKKIDLSLSEFYRLLAKSAPAAIFSTPTRTSKKLIKTQPKLMEALEVLGLKDSIFSASTMAILH
jgi:transposase